MANFISWKAFGKVLENNHLDKIPAYMKVEIFSKFSEMRLTTDEVYAIINGAKKKEILSNVDKKYVQLNLHKLIKEAFSSADIELYLRLDEIDKIFKNYFRENGLKQKDYTDGLRDCWVLAKRVNKEINADILAFSKEELETFEILANIYRSVAEHVENEPIKAKVRGKDQNTGGFVKDETGKYVIETKEFVRIADYVVSTRLAELSNSTLSRISLETAKEFDGFLKSITSVAEENARDSFSKDEVKDLLDKTISLIGRVSADKYNGVRDVLNAYLDEVLKVEDHQKGTKEFEEFSQLTAKQILKRCASIFTQYPETVGFSLDFILGKNMDEAGKRLINSSQSQTSKVAKNAKLLRQYYPNLKLQGMDLKNHLYFSKQGPSHILIITPNTIYDSTNNLVDVILQGFGINIEGLNIPEKISLLKIKGFDIESIYTKDNLFEIFNVNFEKIIKEENNQQKDNIKKNIAELSKYLAPSELQKIVAHNINLILIENEKLIEKLEEIKRESSGDEELFVELFHEFINTKYVIKEKAENSSNPKARGQKNSNKTDDKMEAPEKDYIEVEILGLTGKKDEEVPEVQQDVAFSELYCAICEEMAQIERYAKCERKEEIVQEGLRFSSKNIASILVQLSNNFSAGLKLKFDKALKELENKLALITSFEEFQEKDKEYLNSLIKKAIDTLINRAEYVKSDLSKVDSEIETITLEERDKNSRKKLKEYSIILKKLEELKSINLVMKKYYHLIDEDVNKQLLTDMESEKDSGKKITEYRKLLPTRLEDSLRLRTELDFINRLSQSLESNSIKLEEKIVISENSSEIEIRERIDYLKSQRELKLKNLKNDFKGRMRSNNYTLEDLHEMFSHHPHGKKVVAAIRKIENEIAELEAMLDSLTT